MGSTSPPSLGDWQQYYVMPPKTLEESFQELNDSTTIEILKEDARRQGVPWHVYCYRYGVIGDAQKRRIRRHEVQYDLFDEIERERAG